MTHTTLSSPSWVAAYPRRDNATQHEIATHVCLARKLAQLLQCDVLEPFRPNSPQAQAACYYVPDETLIAPLHARQLGIQDASQFFGGMVPYEFVASKAISHGLCHPTHDAPANWSHALTESLADAVLAGYTAFSKHDALQAGAALLERGPLRIKPVHARAGQGQRVVHHLGELRHAIAGLTDCQRGVVLEENLSDVETYSVGWCHIGSHTLAYVGTQALTQDNHGQDVYGGSYLRCVRGEPVALLELDMTPATRLAVKLALHYDAAVNAAYPALVASRRNYDIALGQSTCGTARAGVLEQSWRAGGASIAEAAALLFLAQHPDCREIDAWTRERYGAAASPADTDEVVFHGEDDQVGVMLKTSGIVRGNHGRP